MPPAVAFTLREAATVLNPPVTERQLRAIVTALGWKPVSHRHTGRDGRPPACYPAERILQLHAAIVPFLDKV
jgi:hypothetical protein